MQTYDRLVRYVPKHSLASTSTAAPHPGLSASRPSPAREGDWHSARSSATHLESQGFERREHSSRVDSERTDRSGEETRDRKRRRFSSRPPDSSTRGDLPDRGELVGRHDRRRVRGESRGRHERANARGGTPGDRERSRSRVRSEGENWRDRRHRGVDLGSHGRDARDRHTHKHAPVLPHMDGNLRQRGQHIDETCRDRRGQQHLLEQDARAHADSSNVAGHNLVASRGSGAGMDELAHLRAHALAAFQQRREKSLRQE